MALAIAATLAVWRFTPDGAAERPWVEDPTRPYPSLTPGPAPLRDPTAPIHSIPTSGSPDGGAGRTDSRLVGHGALGTTRAEIVTAAGGDGLASHWILTFDIDRQDLIARGYELRSQPDVEPVKSAYYAALFEPSSPRMDLGRVLLPEVGMAQLTVKHLDLAPLIEHGSLMLSTTPDGVGRTDFVYFGRGLEGNAVKLLGQGTAQDEAPRTLNLGRIRLRPVPRLGVVRVDPWGESKALEIYVSGRGLSKSPLGQFGRPTPGRLWRFTPDGGELHAFSFSPASEWSVLLKEEGGDLLGSDEASHGEDIHFEYEPPTGVTLSIDLDVHPSARRILLVSDRTAEVLSLEGRAYEARVAAALRTVAIPLPRFRTGNARFTTGLLEVDDGRMRVEVWGRAESGSWERLVARTVSVAGDAVELFL